MSEDKIVMTTCYDASFSRLCALSEAFDYLLVGDSLGMVLYGYENTHSVTLEMMVDHIAAVRRGMKNLHLSKFPQIIGDLPIQTYETEEMAIESSRKLIEAGADIVKLEGPQIEAVSALVEEGFKVCGHIGLTPQSASEYRLKGKTPDEAARLLYEAKELDVAGCEFLVLEMIPADLAAEITNSIKIPTIGIGAGASCSGQVLVSYDLLGMNSSFSPKFLKRFSNLEEECIRAFRQYAEEVRGGSYPSESHSF